MSSFQREWRRFEDADAHVLGISVDSTATKAAWAQSLGGLAFDLLSDFHPHGAVAEQYGVLRPEGTAERAVFIVDKEGRVTWSRVYDVSQAPDVEEVLRGLPSDR